VLTIIYTTLSRLTPKERRRLLSGAAGEVGLQLLDTAFFAALLLLVALYTQQEAVAGHLPVVASGLKDQPLLVLGSFLLAYGGKSALAWWWTSRQWLSVYGVATRLSAQNLARFLRSDYHHYVHVDSAVQVRRVSQQPVEFALYLLRNVQLLLGQAVLLVLIGASLLLYKPQLVGLLALFLLPPAALVLWVLQRRQQGVRAGVKTASARALQYLREALAGYVESQVYGRKDFFVNRYARQQAVLNHQLSGQQAVQAAASRLMEVVAVLAITVLLVGSTLFEGAVSAVTAGAFAAAAYKVLPGLVRIINSVGQIRAYAFVLEDLPVPTTESLHPEAVPEGSRIRSLRLEDVVFSFGTKTILNRFNCSAQSGDFIGIRGLSGRGKTTLVNLLLGFYRPHSGSVYINEQEVQEATAPRWWQRISYVKQQPFFVHDTAVRNVVLTDGPYSEERYQRVVEVSGCARFTGGAVDGIIRENGKNISGGQRQRLALARALYKDFDLLILDEPFSEMDGDAEEELLQHLARLAGEGKIILLITHGSQPLRYCTKLISLDT
jgi:ABC-type multidrug transport system fused ATPase/permease subunit